MKKSTGSFDAAVALAGAHTFTVRQSSWPMTLVLSAGSSCSHMAPKLVLASGADQQAGAAGGAQRSAPTGGAAYGIANQAQVSADATPCTGPRSVTTSPGAGATFDAQSPASGFSFADEPQPASSTSTHRRRIPRR